MKIRTAHINGETTQLLQALREVIAELEEHGETNLPIEANDRTAPALVLAFSTDDKLDNDYEGAPLVEWSEVER